MERRTINKNLAAVSVEERAEESPRIRGHGAVFYDGTPATQFELWPGAVERIMPEAFTEAIDRDDVRGLFNHDANMLLGRTSSGTMSLTTDARGLGFSIDPGATSVARDVVEHVRRGDVQGSSFSFVATEERWTADDDIEVREIRGVQLFDVGPVTFPAYPSTDVQARDAKASRAAWSSGRFDHRYISARNGRRLRLIEMAHTS